MKNLTLKSAMETYSIRKQANRDKQEAIHIQDFDLAEEFAVIVRKAESVIAQFPTVYISYSIGYRRYYEQVVKVGTTFINYQGEKMTKANGYRLVTEIPEITESMKEDMISDSYYY